MRFLVDESTGPGVSRWLRENGHEVFSVYEEARGSEDPALLKKAFAENWILVTNDKDFGERIFRDGFPHKGVVLLRLDDEGTANKIEIMKRLLDLYADRLPGNFVVATEAGVRIR